MIVVTGEDEGKFGAYQVECSNCLRCSPLAVFFKMDAAGELVRVDPYARDAAEGYWNMSAAILDDFLDADEGEDPEED